MCYYVPICVTMCYYVLLCGLCHYAHSVIQFAASLGDAHSTPVHTALYCAHGGSEWLVAATRSRAYTATQTLQGYVCVYV